MILPYLFLYLLPQLLQRREWPQFRQQVLQIPEGLSSLEAMDYEG
jgi:hypothetical protein